MFQHPPSAEAWVCRKAIYLTLCGAKRLTELDEELNAQIQNFALQMGNKQIELVQKADAKLDQVLATMAQLQ